MQSYVKFISFVYIRSLTIVFFVMLSLVFILNISLMYDDETFSYFLQQFLLHKKKLDSDKFHGSYNNKHI